jgi:lathosterol oxidase
MSISSCLLGAGRLAMLGAGMGMSPGTTAGAGPPRGVLAVFTSDPAGLMRFVLGSVAGGLGSYLLISTFFHLRYYKAQAARAAQWKCQPQRFPSPRMWRIDLWLGIANITLASVLSGFLAYWIYASGRSPVYILPRGHSVLEMVVVTLAYYLLTDVIIYWAHRLYHRPTLFRLVHRYHHRNTVPTAFTAFSMHPVEFLTYQSVMLLPLLFLPINAIAVIVILISAQLEALLQHSGVRIAPWIPWMPSTYFHDDHHRYFHVNYGQHLVLWDRLFDSLRRHGRRYGVEVFGGKGAPVPADAPRPPARFVDYGRRAGLRGEPAAIDSSYSSSYSSG